MSAQQPSSDAPVGNFGRAILIGLALFLTCGFLTALSVSPDPRGFGTHQQLGLPPCTFRLFFGYPCIGCGMTTSFSHFIRGQFVEAARANLAGVVFASVFAMMIPWCCYSASIGRFWLVSDPIAVGIRLGMALSILASLHWIMRLSVLFNQ